MDRQCALGEKKFGFRITLHILRRVMDALAIGALAGVLAGVPYDQLFGFSASLNLFVQSTISIIAFASLLSGWPQEIQAAPQCAGQVPRPGGGNHRRVSDQTL